MDDPGAPIPHEDWCGSLCDHKDCGQCTCPRKQRAVLHPHYDLRRGAAPHICPDAYQHHLMLACGRCNYKAAPRPPISIWNTPTTSSGRFDDAKRTLNADLCRAKREDASWSDSDKRFFALAFLALLELACLIYLSVRGVR